MNLIKITSRAGFFVSRTFSRTVRSLLVEHEYAIWLCESLKAAHIAKGRNAGKGRKIVARR